MIIKRDIKKSYVDIERIHYLEEAFSEDLVNSNETNTDQFIDIGQTYSTN